MSKTKKELRELEAIVNLYKEQPDNLVNKIWSWRKKALQAKEEEVVEILEKGGKKAQEFENIQDIYDNGDSADLAGGGFQIGYNRAIEDILSSLKKGETK